jgi:ribose/xylose/arabinose/galactoside ABC-type transport system permease subunit
VPEETALPFGVISPAVESGAAVIHRVLTRVGILPILMLVLIVIFGVIEPRFLAWQNIRTVGIQSVYLIIVSVAQMIVLITGGFDLSVGSSIALTSIVTGSVLIAVTPDLAAIAKAAAAGVAVATLIGAVNGAVVSIFAVSPFIATLAMMSIASGAALLISGGVPIFNFPPDFSDTLATGALFGVPTPWIVAGLVVLSVHLLLSWTKFGRYVYAVGGNAEAAHLSGVPVRRSLFLAYLLAGTLTGVAGVVLTARVGSGEPNLGATVPLESIAAAVLGGVSLRGGEGTLLGAVLGAFFLVFLRNGMDLIRISSYVQMIITGILLIIAIVADRYIHGR